jgi:hypothetical protein
MKYTEKYNMGELISLFCTYTNSLNADILLIFNFNEDNFNNLKESSNLHSLNDYFISELLNFIDKRLNIEYFNKNVLKENQEECWEVGKLLRLMCLNELILRHPENRVDYSKFVMVRK